ncbi:MAG: hypothetical protein H6603_08045 [Flavobacteriales bacterium]|nr:hypothetical protein [Flavobacteriales bacterium]
MSSKRETRFAVWCIDSDDDSKFEQAHFAGITELSDKPRVKAVLDKYRDRPDHIRWSLKGVMVSELLESFEKVLYLDNDLFFFNDPSFLFEKLDESDVLLTPHHYPRDPSKNQNWLEANFKVGLYNAGFIGVNRNAKHIMDWWADCCMYRCEKSLIRGLFDDQKYLDLVPVMHHRTDVLEHAGCNVAGWNVEVCERVLQPDGSILINGKWPLVFAHFNGFSIRTIIHGSDSLLKPYLDKYVSSLREHKATLELAELWRENTVWDRIKLWAWRFLDHLT